MPFDGLLPWLFTTAFAIAIVSVDVVMINADVVSVVSPVLVSTVAVHTVGTAIYVAELV